MRIFSAFFAVCVLFAGCSKSASARGTGAVHFEVTDAVPLQSEENETSVLPEVIKLQNVLDLMSERFKAEVTVSKGDEKLFLQDLNDVLQEESSFRSDDLPVLYLIDKKHSVSSSYVPKDLVPLVKNPLFNINRNDLSLRPDAYSALKELAAAAQKDGITLLVSSTYRSYEYQKNLFNKWVEIDGLEEAERESARPGTSQHQLGSAVDFGSITDDFAETEMGQWIYENAADYGWSLSFPKGYEDVTGYRWECWHFRYIGKTACEFQNKWFCGVQQYMLEFIDAWKKA